MTPAKIDDEMKQQIVIAHKQAEYNTHKAKTKINEAIESRIKCATYIEKAKQLHPQNICDWLSDTDITGKEVKAYLSLYDASKKRSAIYDKRQLLLCGVLETNPDSHNNREKNTLAPPPSVINSAASFFGKFNKAVSRRPVAEMAASERLQTKDVLRPIVESLNKYFEEL